jgi:hypothetical protein
VKRTDGECDVVSPTRSLIDDLIGTLVGILTDGHTGRYG